jgi:hypothetical protein
MTPHDKQGEAKQAIQTERYLHFLSIDSLGRHIQGLGQSKYALLTGGTVSNVPQQG